MAVCRCDTITEQHFKSLEEVGFDHEDAWDIAAIAAFFAMSNRLAHLTDMRPNLEFYNMGRVPRDKSKDKWKRGRKSLGQMLKVCQLCFSFCPVNNQKFSFEMRCNIRSTGMQPDST